MCGAWSTPFPSTPKTDEEATLVSVGFVGFGAVAATFAKPMIEHGAQVSAYDLLLDSQGGREILQRRAQTEGVQFRPLPEVAGRASYVLSTVTTRVARQVAQACVPYLRPGQVYVDLNSTTPAAKVEMAAIIGPTGAQFVEGAILGAVGATGAATRILLGGAMGPPAAQALARLGLNVEHYSAEIGKASQFKALRSIFSKGLEALLIECLVAGRRAGIEADLWDEAVGLMTHHPFDRTAANWIETHAVAYERRYHEMVQVAQVMREIGVEPVMTAATIAFFERSQALGLGEAFPEKPASMDVVIEFIAQRLMERAE